MLQVDRQQTIITARCSQIQTVIILCQNSSKKSDFRIKKSGFTSFKVVKTNWNASTNSSARRHSKSSPRRCHQNLPNVVTITVPLAVPKFKWSSLKLAKSRFTLQIVAPRYKLLSSPKLAKKRFSKLVKSCRSLSKLVNNNLRSLAITQAQEKDISKTVAARQKVRFSRQQKDIFKQSSQSPSKVQFYVRQTKTIVAPRCNRSSLHAANDQFLLIKSHRNLSRASSKSVFRVSKILKMKQDRKGTC